MDGENGELDREGPFHVLSVGTELEFCLGAVPYGIVDPEPDDERKVYGIMEREISANSAEPTIPQVFRFEIQQRIDRAERTQRHLANTLVKAGYKAVAEIDMNMDPHDMSLDCWTITEDSTIQPPAAEGDEKRYVFQKIEVVSPAFLATEGSLAQIREICLLIIRTYRTCGGPSTGLHVHVGNSTRGFDSETLQNVMAMLWTFEPQLETLHPEHRRNNDYCLPLRRASGLTLRMAAENIPLRKSLDVIYKTTSINDLIWLMGSADGSGYKMCVNIHNLMEPYVDADGLSCQRDDEVKKTIEFRGHEGTLDPARVYWWTKVCLRVVEFSQECQIWKLRVWLSWHIHDTVDGFPAVALLYAMKLPLAAQYYEEQLNKRDAVSDKSRTLISFSPQDRF